MKQFLVFSALFLITHIWCTCSNSMHGGTFLAMAGKDSVVLVSDSRFSSQKTGSMLLGKHNRFVFRAGSKSLVGCFGLDADARTLMHKLRGKLQDYSDNEVDPDNVARVVSNVLYQNNLLLSPIVTGLKRNGLPYICTMDGLGAQTVSDKYAVVGTANEGLLALCESLYIPNLDSPDLLELAERCFNLAMQRDVMSGCDFRIATLTKDAIYVTDVEKLDV